MTREEVTIHLNILLANRCWDCRKRAGSKVCDEKCMFKQAFNEAIEALTDRPTGMWVDKGGYSECSECGEVAQKVELCDCVYERLTNYCPNCGAIMENKE